MNKKDKEDLIEFLETAQRIKPNWTIEQLREFALKDYSIKSNEPNEVESVGKNEQQQEDFFPTFLICTKFPFCKEQCATCKEHEPKKSD